MHVQVKWVVVKVCDVNNVAIILVVVMLWQFDVVATLHMLIFCQCHLCSVSTM